eukprot:Nk52_evm25s249 gene=Nk52_evmTU25s249
MGGGSKGRVGKQSQGGQSLRRLDGVQLQRELRMLKEELNQRLGENGSQYWVVFVQFTIGRASKKELDESAMKYLTSDKVHLHNKFVRCLLAIAQAGIGNGSEAGGVGGVSGGGGGAGGGGGILSLGGYGGGLGGMVEGASGGGGYTSTVMSKKRKMDLADGFGDGRNSLRHPFYRDSEKLYYERGNKTNSGASDGESKEKGEGKKEDKGVKRKLDKGEAAAAGVEVSAAEKGKEVVGDGEEESSSKLPVGFLDISRMSKNPEKKKLMQTLASEFTSTGLLDHLIAATREEDMHPEEGSWGSAGDPRSICVGQFPDKDQLRVMLHLALYEKRVNSVCDEMVDYVMEYMRDSMRKLVENAAEMKMSLDKATSSLDDIASGDAMNARQQKESSDGDISMTLEDILYAVKIRPELVKGDSLVMEKLLSLLHHGGV